MRANEFVTERQRVDEVVPLVIGGLTALGIGMQGYETYKDIQDYRAGRIDDKELTRRIGTDAAIAVAGGAIGKGVAGLYGAGKAGIDVFKNAMKHKDKAKDATDAVTKTTPKPGSTIQTPKGDRVAGVDGKATAVKPTDKAGVAKIKQATKKQDGAKPGAAAASAATKKADDVAKKKPSGGKAGAAVASVATKSKNVLKKPIVRGAGLAALANQTGNSISDFLKGIEDIKDREARGDYGQKKYLYKGKKDIGQDKVVKIGAQNPDPNRVIPGKS